MNNRIAIIGYSVHLPGGDSPGDLDRFLMSGRSAVEEYTRDELIDQGLPAEEIDSPRYVRRSAATSWTVESAKYLDRLSARERQVTDPQQLLFFDCCVAALVHAGISSDTVAGASVACVGGIGMGLYAGNGLSGFFNDALRYDRYLLNEAVPPEILIGNASDHTVGRVSYKLGLTGPSVNVQTACSTALASIEYACLLLRASRAELALAGAASLYYPARRGYRYERGGILSSDGVCRAFDASANGTVGGSGGGVFVLKRLDDAQRDGDTIHGVIEGIVQGSDGQSRASYTAPGYEGQARVIRGAMAEAGVQPSDISYVEAHGTGTPVGDMVELSVLNDVFAGRDISLPVGSVKPALGHLDAAAAAASLANVLLGLRRGAMPATVNFVQPAPGFADGVARPFATPADLRRAHRDGITYVGISSFGASGTSVHAVVSDYGLTGQADVPDRDIGTAAEPRPAVRLSGGSLDPGSVPGPVQHLPADQESVQNEVTRLLLDRAKTDDLRAEDIGQIGPIDLGIESIDLLAIAKAIEDRWSVVFEVLDMLAFVSVDEMVGEIVAQAQAREPGCDG